MQLPREELPQRRLGKKRTGEILIEMEFITPQQLDQALAEQKTSRLRIGEILIEHGWLTAGATYCGPGRTARGQAS